MTGSNMKVYKPIEVGHKFICISMCTQGYVSAPLDAHGLSSLCSVNALDPDSPPVQAVHLLCSWGQNDGHLV